MCYQLCAQKSKFCADSKKNVSFAFRSSDVTCHESHVIFFVVKKIIGARWWTVCYQRGLPRLVSRPIKSLNIARILKKLGRCASSCLSLLEPLMSHVMCHVFIFLLLVELVGGGSVINRAYPVYFQGLSMANIGHIFTSHASHR